jgi:hypothetical protein
MEVEVLEIFLKCPQVDKDNIYLIIMEEILTILNLFLNYLLLILLINLNLKLLFIIILY